MKDLFLKVWLRYAIGMSLYWGIRGLILYTTDLVERLGTERKKKLYLLRKKGITWGILLVGVYQFILNFVGSFAGWCCLYIFIKHTSFTDLKLADFVLIILGIIGISGLLPNFIKGIVIFPKAIATYFTKKLEELE